MMTLLFAVQQIRRHLIIGNKEIFQLIILRIVNCPKYKSVQYIRLFKNRLLKTILMIMMM